MAKIPTPRSFNRIVGDMLDIFLSKLGLKKVKKGSPVLSIFEAAAMSDLRSSQAIFDLLNSKDLDRASGVALDRIGESEDLPRLTESLASGTVNIADSRFTKISTKVYQGLPAPIVGSAQIFVTDASAFPTSGSIYIGRDTANYEGPIAYSGATKSLDGSYWTLTLSSNTTKFHNLGENVILAQGGNRVIGAGTVCQTPQGNISDAVQFTTLYPATVLDGEVEVQGVVVVAKKAGIIGNVPAGAISAFASNPFSGASISNPLPLSNGRATENDIDYRERIKNARASRALATALALKTNVLGITSSDENKRVTSASVVRRQGFPTTLYIDDGTGYEERSSGIAIESLNDLALGGEQYFEVSQRPVTKAFVKTTIAAPFTMVDGSKLAMKVGGIYYEHSFLEGDFRNIASATAYEIVASINADSTIQFSARTADGGTKVVVFAKTDENEDVEVVAPSTGTDANTVLLFPLGRVDTLRLYKNDRLLSKDGKLAILASNLSGLWNAFSGTETLTISVDGTPAVTYSFTDADFVNAGTSFSTLGKNTPEAWAAVFNSRIPGISATADASSITLTSNAGRVARASIVISGGTLVAKGMFGVATAQGAVRDYTLDRNVSQIRLEVPLAIGDRLSAGSLNTRGFYESLDISPVTIGGSGASAFVAVDGSAKVIKTGITPSNLFDISKTTTAAFGTLYRITAESGAPFTNVQVGDWLLIWDSAAAWAQFQGMWRVATASSTFIEFEHVDLGGVTGTGFSFQDTGIAIVRYSGQMQKVTVPAGSNYTADSIAAAITLLGAQAFEYRTNRVRVRTNSFKDTGDIAVVAVDTEGQKLLFTPGNAVVNKDSHLGSVESANAEIGTPDFTNLSVTSSTGASQMNVTGTIGADRIVVGLRNNVNGRYGNNRSFWSPLTQVVTGSPNNITVRRAVSVAWRPADRIFMASPYAIGPHDDITVVANGDTESGRFTVPLWRALRPVGGTYGTTNTFKDIVDGTGTPSFLAAAFGIDFKFEDAAVYMRARAKSHAADATKSTLWRYKEFGISGNHAKVAHGYPKTASANVACVVNEYGSTGNGNTAADTEIFITLATDVKKTGLNVRNTTSLGYGYNSTIPTIPAVTIVTGLAIASGSMTRVGTVVTVTPTLPSGLYTVTTHGIPATTGSNPTVVWIQCSDPNFPSGAKSITGVTGTTFTYSEAGAAVSSAQPATVSLDSIGEAKISGALPSSIVVGDLVRLENDSNIPANFRDQTIQITHIGPQFVQGYAERTGGSSNQTLSWQLLNDASKLNFYPLKPASNTATAIAAAINALDAKCPVTAKVLGDGSGTIAKSTRDELLTVPANYQLVDGINWVKTTINPGNSTTDYQLTFKNGVDANLVTGADWANEEVRIAPITAKLVTDWMNLPALSGLFTACSILPSSQAQRVQIATLTPGSGGSVQVQGGTGNSAVGTILGSSTTSGLYSMATIRAAEALGFSGGQWVALDNTLPLAKSGVFDSTTALTSIDTSGNFTLSAGPDVFTEYVGDRITDDTVSVEKQGRYVAIIGVAIGDAVEGDWIRISPPTTPGSDISTVNQGIFRIVRISPDITVVWIENPNAVEEVNVKCDLHFYTADSMMPGDTLSISTAAWGTENEGTWVIESVGGSPSFSNTLQFKVSVASKATTATGAVTALGTTEAKKVLCFEAKPTHLVKRIQAIIPNQSDVTLADVKFDTQYMSTHIGAAVNTVMTALDKLAFPLSISQGIDGYSYSTGLIGEASRVVYGDERNSAAYPGVAAAGDQINIVGPLVKRVQVSIGVRARLGVPLKDIADQVRSAVASVINRAGVGEAISLSDVASAASKVNGVIAVTILSPIWNVGSDLISVQPFEKPLVLNVEQDILVSFVGD